MMARVPSCERGLLPPLPAVSTVARRYSSACARLASRPRSSTLLLLSSSRRRLFLHHSFSFLRPSRPHTRSFHRFPTLFCLVRQHDAEWRRTASARRRLYRHILNPMYTTLQCTLNPSHAQNVIVECVARMSCTVTTTPHATRKLAKLPTVKPPTRHKDMNAPAASLSSSSTTSTAPSMHKLHSRPLESPNPPCTRIR